MIAIDWTCSYVYLQCICFYWFVYKKVRKRFSYIYSIRERESILFPSITKYIYTKSTTVSVPSLGPLHPLSCKRVCFPPELRGAGGGGYTVHTRLRVRGWGCPNSDDCRESLVGTLSTLCPVQILPVTARDSWSMLCIQFVQLWASGTWFVED